MGPCGFALHWEPPQGQVIFPITLNHIPQNWSRLQFVFCRMTRGVSLSQTNRRGGGGETTRLPATPTKAAQCFVLSGSMPCDHCRHSLRHCGSRGGGKGSGFRLLTFQSFHFPRSLCPFHAPRRVALRPQNGDTGGRDGRSGKTLNEAVGMGLRAAAC